MKKEVTLGQILSVGVPLLATIITAWFTLNNKVTTHQEQIKALQEKTAKFDNIVERIEAKIDKLNEVQLQILVKMENKSDRPK